MRLHIRLHTIPYWMWSSRHLSDPSPGSRNHSIIHYQLFDISLIEHPTRYIWDGLRIIFTTLTYQLFDVSLI